MYTLSEIDAKIAQSTALRLSGAELLFDRARAQTACNGIGTGTSAGDADIQTLRDRSWTVTIH